MPGRLEEIEKIEVQLKQKPPTKDQPSEGGHFEVRNAIVARIRRIAGEDSIKRIVPIQSEGDHKTQDIAFDMEEASYLATVTYNNSLTQGWVSSIQKEPKKC